MSVKTLDDLFKAQLKDMYYAENQLFKKGRCFPSGLFSFL